MPEPVEKPGRWSWEAERALALSAPNSSQMNREGKGERGPWACGGGGVRVQTVPELFLCVEKKYKNLHFKMHFNI